MLEAVADVRVGLQVEDPIAALECSLEQPLVEHVTFVERPARLG